MARTLAAGVRPGRAFGGLERRHVGGEISGPFDRPRGRLLKRRFYGEDLTNLTQSNIQL
jgi:hypothetical protein